MDTEFGVKALRAVLAGGALALALATPSYADDPSTLGLFELDGDTTILNAISPYGPAQDWADMVPGTLQTNSYFKATSGIIPDTQGLVFTSGSKDTGDIGTWGWRSGSSPSKADIQNAYGAAYQYQNGNLIVYFGADRATNTGTVATGFWFFKKQVCPNKDGTFGDSSIDPTTGYCYPNANRASHSDGDTLVAANYDNGGHVGTVAVYRWNGSTNQLDTVGTLNNQPGSTGLFCGNPITKSLVDPTVCGITNKGLTTISWLTKQAPAGTFFEGGIDITSVAPSAACFTSFMAMSRASTSTDSSLKNFVFSKFGVCSDRITKSCSQSATNPSLNPATGLYHYVFHSVVTNTGTGPIYDATVTEGDVFTDSNLDKSGSQCSITAITPIAGTPQISTSTPARLILYSGNGPSVITPVKVADSMPVNSSLDLQIDCDSSRNGLVNTINLNSKVSSELTTFDVPLASYTTGATEICSYSIPTAVEVSKSCSSVKMVGNVTPQVCVDVTVSNNSQQAVDITSLTDAESFGQATPILTDFTKANGSSATLQQGASVTFNHCYTPAATTGDLAALSVSYSDQVSVTAVGVTDKTQVNSSSNTLYCKLCQ